MKTPPTRITIRLQRVDQAMPADPVERDLCGAARTLAGDDRLVADILRAVQADRAARMASAFIAFDDPARELARRRMIARGSVVAVACVVLGVGVWVLMDAAPTPTPAPAAAPASGAGGQASEGQAGRSSEKATGVRRAVLAPPAVRRSTPLRYGSRSEPHHRLEI